MKEFFDRLLSIYMVKPLLLLLLAIIALVCAIKTEGVSLIVILIVLGAFFLLIFAFFKEISHEIGREEWFDSVKKGLQFSTEVKAYLRDFDHPDDLAQTNSRSDIVKIMEFIATIIVNHSDKVRIVGYRDTSSGKKNPLDWISGEMKKINPNITPDNYIDRSVKILKKQPSANSSTFYLFEGRSLLYNQYDGSGKWRYYKVDLTTSVIPFFINEGLQTFFVTA